MPLTPSIESEAGKAPLIGLTLTQLRQIALDAGLPAFAGGQMAQWLYQKRVSSIEQMTNLSKSARERLAEHYCVGLLPPVGSAASADGTVKYLFPGAGGVDIEAVYIPDRERATLCVSSQAGCRMGCAFCMTGRLGFHGSLTARDIINQILTVDSLHGPASEAHDTPALSNIVFMGMGEPLDNLDALLPVLEILTAKWGLAWSPKRITVSTVGHNIQALRRLVETTKVHVAVSVHSPLHEQRQELMPVERAVPVRDIMGALRNYDFAHQRRLSVEYIMWGGVNDTQRHADALARLIKGTSARVNLIRFHSIPLSPLCSATDEAMVAFRDRLNALGVTATIRTSRGEDIQAACGLLAGKNNIKNENTHS